MANTTNYNWETPDDTDLVKDGAAAIRTLGSSVDTTTKALNPSTTLGDIEYRSATANTNTRLPIGTTGQILSVVAGVPSWVANDVGDITEVAAGTGITGGGTSGSVTITNSMATAIDAKGDLIVGTGADTFSRLAVGTNTYVLTADSAEATGLKWVAPSGGSTFVGCSIYKTSNQSIANDTDEVITFGSEEFDTDAFHSTSTNTSRITIPAGKGGKYLVVGQASWAANATGQRRLMVFLNGSSISMGVMANPLTVSGQPTRYNMSFIKDFVATDYIELAAFQTSGGALDIQGFQSTTRFGVVYLGA